MDDDVVDQAHRGLDDAPVQADSAAAVAASTPLLLVGDHDAEHRDGGLRPPGFHPFRQPLGRMTAEPGDEGDPDVGGGAAGLPQARALPDTEIRL